MTEKVTVSPWERQADAARRIDIDRRRLSMAIKRRKMRTKMMFGNRMVNRADVNAYMDWMRQRKA